MQTKRDDMPALRASKCNPVRLVQIISNKGVPNAFIERRCKAGIFWLDEIKYPLDTLGSDYTLVKFVSGELLQHHERRASDVLLAQKLDACLALGDGIGNHVVKGATGGRDCDIVFVWNRA
jgi:hypothetical protein